MALTVCGIVSLQNVKAQSLQLVFLGLGLLQPGLAQNRLFESLELTVEGQTTPPINVTQLTAGEHIVRCMLICFYPINLSLNFTMWAQPSGRGQPRGTTKTILDTELSRLAGSRMYRASQNFAIQVKNTTKSLSCREDQSFGGSPVTTTLKIHKCSLQWVGTALNDNPRPDATSPGWYFRLPYRDKIRCEASLFCGTSTLPSVPHPIQFEVWLDSEKLDIPPVTVVRIQKRTQGVHRIDIGRYDVQQNFSTNFTRKDHGKIVTCIETKTGMRSRFTLVLCDPSETTTSTTTTTPTTNTTCIVQTNDDAGGKSIPTREDSSKHRWVVYGLGIGGVLALLGLTWGLLVFGKKRATEAKPRSAAGGPQAPGSGAVASPPLPAAAALGDGASAVSKSKGFASDASTKSRCTATGCSRSPLSAVAAGHDYEDDGASEFSESTGFTSDTSTKSEATTTSEFSTSQADQSAVDLSPQLAAAVDLSPQLATPVDLSPQLATAVDLSPQLAKAAPCRTECGEHCSVCGTIIPDNVSPLSQ